MMMDLHKGNFLDFTNMHCQSKAYSLILFPTFSKNDLATTIISIVIGYILMSSVIIFRTINN